MGIDDQTVREIVRRVLSVTRPARIIVFGSAAARAMTPDSDIDLLVLEDAPADSYEETVALLQALRGMGVPFDVIVMATEWFEDSKNVVGGLAFPANKRGKVIFNSTR